MKIGYASDIHNEFGAREINVPPDIDVLCLAGDIEVKPRDSRMVLELFRTQTRAPILYILGNHEYYGHLYQNVVPQYKAQISKIENAYVLERESIIIGDTRFLGTTLWSNLQNPIHALRAEQYMNDFRKIQVERQGGSRSRLRATDYVREFDTSCLWLADEMQKNWNGKTVVVTHHSPSGITCAAEHKSDILRYAYHSDLDNFIFDTQPELWIYGHDHKSAIHQLGSTVIASNQLGYPHEQLGSTIAVIEI